jgi:hypothetical protein
MLLQKLEPRRSKLKELFIVLKTKFEYLQAKIFVDVEGCPGNPEDYGFHHS